MIVTPGSHLFKIIRKYVKKKKKKLQLLRDVSATHTANAPAYNFQRNKLEPPVVLINLHILLAQYLTRANPRNVYV